MECFAPTLFVAPGTVAYNIIMHNDFFILVCEIEFLISYSSLIGLLQIFEAMRHFI